MKKDFSSFSMDKPKSDKKGVMNEKLKAYYSKRKMNVNQRKGK